jgi:hypothetical protein
VANDECELSVSGLHDCRHYDHIAAMTGANSAGRKVVEAYATDCYRDCWKMGCSTTVHKCGFRARRAQRATEPLSRPA